MINKKIYIVLIAAAAGVLISCGGAKTQSSQVRSQDGGRAQEQTARRSRADRAEPSAATAGTAAEDLRGMRVNLMGLSIPVGMAVAEASSESEARAAALDSARADLIRRISVQTHLFGETYAANIGADARKKWEDAVALMSAGAARTVPEFKSAVEHDRANRTFKAHVMVVYDPVQYKQALENAAIGNDVFNRRARIDELRRRMDAIISDFDSKYRRGR